MRTLHAYLLRQLIASLVMTVAVFTFVMLLGNAVKEVLTLLVGGKASVGAIGTALLLLVPWVLAFALPMGLLTSALLVFGRLSADQELTAVRASGVSLLSLATPALLLSLALTLVCGWVNLHLAPQSRVAYKRLLLNVGVAQPGLLLPERTFIKDFPNRIIYLGQVRGSQVKDILMYKLAPDGSVEFYVRAAEGTVEMDRVNQRVTVRLREAWHVGLHEGKRVPVYTGESEFSETLAPRGAEKVRLSDMTFAQLRQELREIEARLSIVPPQARLTPEDSAARRALHRPFVDLTAPVRVQMHRQLAFSFACVGFTLIGIPLGLRAHRRETTFGIAVALILVLVYYSFFLLSQALETRPEFAPHLLAWVPNILFQAIGAVLLWRANRW